MITQQFAVLYETVQQLQQVMQSGSKSTGISPSDNALFTYEDYLSSDVRVTHLCQLEKS